MMLSIRYVLLFCAMTCAFPRAHASSTDSLRCDKGLISVGDDRQDIEEACGPPAFVDGRHAEKIVRTYQKLRSSHTGGKEDPGHRRNIDRDYRFINERTTSIDIEEWTYNFGSSRFVQTLTFENRRLISIVTGSYGFNHVPNPGSIAGKGDSKAVVFMKYGQPARKEARPAVNGGVDYREEGNFLYAVELIQPTVEEEWVYDFGQDRFLQKIYFQNNRVVDIRSLDKRGTRQ